MKSRITVRGLVSISTFLFLISCDINVDSGNRSGTVADDYIEEPITSSQMKYEKALITSNAVIEKIENGEYDYIYNNYIDDASKKVLTVQELQKIYSGAVAAMGPIKKYKKMQWGFLPKTENGLDYLISYKIIEHEKATLNYSFSFLRNGNYEKISGVGIRPRKGVRGPAQL
jgi:hypothetical protein